MEVVLGNYIKAQNNFISKEAALLEYLSRVRYFKSEVIMLIDFISISCQYCSIVSEA